MPEDPAARPFTRPVIRLPARGVIFTRILIDRPETSMIIRLRPGWDAVAHFLETGTYDQAALPASLRRYGSCHMCMSSAACMIAPAWNGSWHNNRGLISSTVVLTCWHTVKLYR